MLKIILREGKWLRYLRLKFIFALIRIIYFKIKYGKNLQFNWKNTYFGKRADIEVKGNGKILLNNSRGKVYFKKCCQLISSNGLIKIDSYCFFNRNCSLTSHIGIDIGTHCMFGPNVSIYDSDHRHDIPDKYFSEQDYIKKPVSIGSNVWVGTNSVITKGVKIGNNVIIAANSVVTKNLPSNGIYGGTPAIFIKAIDSDK